DAMLLALAVTFFMEIRRSSASSPDHIIANTRI
ncbi:MAG: hypothetical protein ACI9QL_001408, partial [Candidatus Omnitrophota bacterium]